MDNVYMTPIRYKNFAGKERNTQLHFHITPVEFLDWAMDHPDQANDLIETLANLTTGEDANLDDATTDQKYAMLRLVRTLAELGYGKPDTDGDVFDKTDTPKFKFSAAYDAFRLFLFENPKEFVRFNETLLNEEVIAEFGKRVANFGANEEPAENGQPAKQKAGAKSYKEMSREELIAAMAERNAEQ